jgi:integrase
MIRHDGESDFHRLEPRRKRQMNAVVYSMLGEAAMNERLLSYTDVGNAVGLDMNNPDDRDRLSEILDEVSLSEHKNGSPLLSVVVIRADMGRPGKGFFKMAKSAGLYNGKTDLDEAVFFAREFQRAVAPAKGWCLAMAVYKRGGTWWFKFVWNGEQIRESTKQRNKRIAEQIEAARRTQMAKGEVGLRDRAPVPTFAEFVKRDFLPHIEIHFAEKTTTLSYYRVQLGHLTSHAPLAAAKLDEITAETIAGFVEKRRQAEYEVSSINRALQVLRRALHLAVEWGKVEKFPAKVSLIPGERRRERVLSAEDEVAYLKAAEKIGVSILVAYEKALSGIRAAQRGEQPRKPEDPYLLVDVATILLDCGLRPEECYRLRWEYFRGDTIYIPHGKTVNARREIPLSERARTVLEGRRGSESVWVFPAPTASGHIEQSTLKRQHVRACEAAELAAFVPYTFRHTCLTRWAKILDPYTLAYLAGHSDFGTTKRYVHPNLNTAREALERARQAQGGHKSGHNAETGSQPEPAALRAIA